jgi:hypothetical protein
MKKGVKKPHSHTLNPGAYYFGELHESTEFIFLFLFRASISDGVCADQGAL